MNEDEGERTVNANDRLWDRQIYDADGREVGKVDNLELAPKGNGLVVTALLCGPTALGPRIGDRLGIWWVAIGRRLRNEPDPRPLRIPMDLVCRFDQHEVRLTVSIDDLPGNPMGKWSRDKIVGRIPGSRR